MVDLPGISFLRTTREKTPVIYPPGETFPVGGSKVVRQSDRDQVAVIAAGITLHEALKAYEALKSEGIAIRVIDAYSVKPIDRETLHRAARDTQGKLVVVEDHWFEGGLGDAVLDAFVGTRVDGLRRGQAGRPRDARLGHARGTDERRRHRRGPSHPGGQMLAVARWRWSPSGSQGVASVPARWATPIAPKPVGGCLATRRDGLSAIWSHRIPARTRGLGRTVLEGLDQRSDCFSLAPAQRTVE